MRTEQQAAEKPGPTAWQPSNRQMLLLALGAVALTVAIRLTLFWFPMGQDAGTIAYVGRRWIAGSLPYKDMWDYRAPALFLMSGTVVRLLGPSAVACRLAMMGIDLATLGLIYCFVRQWGSRVEAIAAAAIYGFFSGAVLVQGDCLGPGPPMNFLVVLAFLAAFRSNGRPVLWLLLSGVAGGLAVCFRPVALLYLLALVLWQASVRHGSESRGRRWLLRPAVMVLGALVPVACFVAYFYHREALYWFWRHGVLYNAQYRWHIGSTWHQWVRKLKRAWPMAPEQGALWLFAGGWAIHAFSVGYRRETGLVALWSGVSLVGAMLALRPEPTHFIQTIPPFAIAAGLAVTNPSEHLLRRDERGRLETSSSLLIVFTVAFALGFVYVERKAFRDLTSKVELKTDKAAVEVAAYIRETTAPREKVYLWGTRPQIYVLANRWAAHRFFYNRYLDLRSEEVRPQVRDFFSPEVYGDIILRLEEVKPEFFVITEKASDEEASDEELEQFAQWLHGWLRDRDPQGLPPYDDWFRELDLESLEAFLRWYGYLRRQYEIGRSSQPGVFDATSTHGESGADNAHGLGPFAEWVDYLCRNHKLLKTIKSKPYAFTIFVRKDRQPPG